MEQINLTQNEYEILRVMIFREYLDYFNSIDIKTLCEYDDISLSKVYVGKTLKKLKDNNLVEEGMRKGKAFTYFVTPFGYEYVLSIIAKSSNKEIEDMKKEIKLIKGSEEDELNEE